MLPCLTTFFLMDYFLPPPAFIGIERKIWFCDMNEYRTTQNMENDRGRPNQHMNTSQTCNIDARSE